MIEWLAGALAGGAVASTYWVQIAPALARRRVRRNSTTWECGRCGFVVVAHRSEGVTAQVLADVDEIVAAHRDECGG